MVPEGEVADDCYPNCIIYHQHIASVNAITQVFVGLHKICTCKLFLFLFYSQIHHDISHSL